MTERKDIYITNFDLQRLLELINSDKEFAEEERAMLVKLDGKLDCAKVVYWRDIPPNVITMNSKVCLKDLFTNEKIVLVLVFPSDANPERNRFSILTPIGTTLLGCQIGDIIDRQVIEGEYGRFVVEEILYQPEATGNFNL